MIPKRILLENFLSFGSPETEIRFADDEPLWVLGGPNGVGKSAVFDAMTYALYGEHRGGATDHTSLIRHGANAFRVVFEFEFNGVNYQITRNRPRTGRPTHSIKQWADDAWSKTVQLPSASSRQDPIKLWTERTLGVGFAAFKASVLLRQGEADAIILAGGSERLNILKKIIGLEAYETLSENVHARTRRCKERFDDLKTQRNALTPISEGDLQAARDELGAREQERSKAHEDLARAVERVPTAKQWAALDAEFKKLNQQVQDADVRARDANRIRADHERLSDLTDTLPVLQKLLRLCEQIATAKKTLIERQAEATRGGNAVKAKQLRDEMWQEQKFVDAADEVVKLRNEVAAFDPKLADQLKAARERVQSDTDALTATLEAKAAAAGLLTQSTEKQESFAQVQAGVNCSLCGQEVTAKHAKAERERLAKEIKQLEKKVSVWAIKELADKKAKKAAEDEWDRLDKLARKRDTAVRLLSAKEETLRGLGVTAEPDELRRRLDEKKAEVKFLEKEVGDQALADLDVLKKRLADLEAKAQADEKNIAELSGQQATLLAQLSPKWSTSVDKLDTKTLQALDAEQKSLVAAGVQEQFRQLELDVAQRDEWIKRLEDLRRKIDEIPTDCRVLVGIAETQRENARLAAINADTVRDAAKKKAEDLAAEADRFRKLVADVAAAEKKSDLHRKLDDLLGKAGIQRELVRSAERDIVRMANDTVQNLSDGDLTVQLESGADGDDQAFALQIRRADGPTPIGVNYLSGSQKFRVAIAVALAIGRFAAGQARPLESVIIDEGFGSLDKDGLRAAAAELNRLRQHLRRIVLVSHQEDFADQFPVVIRLATGENGTVATAVRK